MRDKDLDASTSELSAKDHDDRTRTLMKEVETTYSQIWNNSARCSSKARPYSRKGKDSIGRRGGGGGGYVL